LSSSKKFVVLKEL